MPARAFPILSLAILVGLLASGASARDPKKDKDPPPVDKEMQPKLVTLEDKVIPLSKALAELEKQTGIKVEDRRRDKDEDPKLKLALQKVTFWQALEAMAKSADLRISLYERDRKLALVNHQDGYRELPISYDGLFRTVVRRITAIRDLEHDDPIYIAHLEVSWEPRFQAFLVETKPDTLQVQAGKGRVLKAPDDAKGQAPVNYRGSIDLEMRLPAVPRSAAQISLLKGELSLIGSSRMLTFDYDGLDKFTRKNEVEKTQEGVKSRLREFTVERDIWTVGFRLEYPADGPKFESFQSWMVNNKVFLENKDGKRFPENGGYEVVEQTANTAIIRYRFVDDDKKPWLGKPGDWKLIYQTPAKFQEIPIKYEFKDVPLP